MTLLTPRPGILQIDPYVGGEADLAGHNRVIRLASNENAFGPSPNAISAYQELAGDLHRYPDGGHAELRRTIGKRYGLDPEQIVCGAGSDELLSMLGKAYAGPGDEAIHTEHSFAMYPIITRSAGALPVSVPEQNLRTDVSAILDAVTTRTRIVFLANPNNPTGSYIPASELQRLRDGLPENVLLIIDAAYSEYVSADDYTDGAQLVDASPNTVMTRTFSKIYGLAALRLGWVYCPPDVADVLNRVRGPFNVTAAALAAGIEAIRDTQHVETSRKHNDLWLARLSQKLEALGLVVPPSVGNFVLVRFPDTAGKTAADALEFLNGRGIIPRRMAGYGLPDSLRITIGLDDENEAVIEALSDFMKG